MARKAQDAEWMAETWNKLARGPVDSETETYRSKLQGSKGLSNRARARLIFLEMPDEVSRALGRDTCDRCVNLSDAKSLQDFQHYPLEDHLRDIAKSLNNRRGHSTVFTEKELTDRDFKDQGAVQRFLDWIREEEIFTDLLDKPRLKLLPSAPRQAKLLDIEAFLCNPDGPSVLVIHQQGMRRGLTALAGELIDRLRANEGLRSKKPVIYLPLWPNAHVKRRIKPDVLSGWLLAFFEGRKLDPNLEISKPDQWHRDLRKVREMMSERPGIFIIDLYRSPGRQLPYLSAAMQDDPLLPILEQLIHPIPKLETPPGRFRQNRIIILADRPIYHHLPFPVNSLEFPLPSVEAVRQLVRELEIENPLHLQPEITDDTSLDLVAALLRHSANPEHFGNSRSHLIDYYISKVSEDDAAYAVLSLVAFSFDGLYFDTLRRLLEQIAVCTGLERWRKVHSLDDKALHAILNQFVRDRVLDECQSPEQKAPEGARQVTIYDLSAAHLRYHLLRDMVKKSPRPFILLLHRLIAEESLLQYTRRLQETDWEARFGSTYHRLYWQFFYHAYFSLGGPGDHLNSIAAVPHVLPSRNDEAFRRLYAVFFRLLMDGPPHWELSRVLGREGLKADILALARRAGSPTCQRDILEPNKAWETSSEGPYLSNHIDISMDNVAEDMRLSLARACFHLGRLQEAGYLISEPSREEAKKLDLDIDLAHAEDYATQAKIKAKIDDEITELFTNGRAFLDGIDKACTKPASINDAQNLAEWSAPLLKIIMDDNDSSPNLTQCSDLLCRRAEALSLMGEGIELRDSLQYFYPSFMQFMIAETLRRKTFESDPLGRSYVVNGRSTRVLVRVALRMVGAHDRLPGEMEAYPTRSFFVRQARRHIDIITRYFSRYASELPGILITKARYTRVVGGPKMESLQEALDILADADAMIWAASERQDVRMSLLLERCKVFREIAKVFRNLEGTADKHDLAELHAWSDYESLHKLTETSGSKAWTKVVMDLGRALADAFEHPKIIPGHGRGKRR